MTSTIPMRSYGIGQPVRRGETYVFLTGGGQCVDDIDLSRLCHAVVVTSPHANALAIRIDKSGKTPRRDSVLTGKNVAADTGRCHQISCRRDIGGPKGLLTRRPISVADHVRCIGDRVALVVAETQEQAQ